MRETEGKTVVEAEGLKPWGCENCGADLKYAPGTKHLKCEYCAHMNEIPTLDAEIAEFDLSQALESTQQLPMENASFVLCHGCGAGCSFAATEQSRRCPYCDTALVLANSKEASFIAPKSLLPFGIDAKKASDAFRAWIQSLWFAPNELKRVSLTITSLKGIYLPYWTYDAATQSQYIGQRGDYYYTTETVYRNGRTETRSVRRTRWSHVSGNHAKVFDDVLVPASKSMPAKHLEALEPWDLRSLKPYDPRYLAGFITERYQVQLKEGFQRARNRMEEIIRQEICKQIGGDQQRIVSLKTQYSQLTFKHLLLPAYVCAFRYSNRVFKFVVNARTAEVQGERPWSWVKITALVLLILIIVVAVTWNMDKEEAAEIFLRILGS